MTSTEDAYGQYVPKEYAVRIEAALNSAHERIARLTEDVVQFQAALQVSEDGRALAEALVLSHEGHIATLEEALAAERGIVDWIAEYIREVERSANFMVVWWVKGCAWRHTEVPKTNPPGDALRAVVAKAQGKEPTP